MEDTMTEEQVDAVNLEATSAEAVTMPDAPEAAPLEASANDANKITDLTQIEQALEAVIFAAPKAITLLRLRNIMNAFNYETSNLKEILESLIAKYEKTGFQLVKVAGGYQFRTHPEHAPLMQKLLEDKPARLSPSALEVLAIAAYKQPITRSEIDAVRGVDSGHLMKGLLEKNLVRTLGHSESPGRPLLYGTAPYFLEVFGLNSLDDLPAVEEFQRELTATGGEGEDGEPVVLAPEPGYGEGTLIDRASPLAAEPDRGEFDARSVEADEKPDFGIAERAAAEVNA